MKKIVFLFLTFVSLYANVSSDIFAKWNINYGDLLTDKGKYLEAYEAYNSAIEATAIEKIKIDATIKKANILYLYLDETKMATDLYLDIYNKYGKTKEAEFALYQASILKKNIDLYDEYLRNYRNGKFYFQIKFLKNKLIANLKIPSKPKPKVKKKTILKNKVALIRVLLHKKISKVDIRGNLNINNQNFSATRFSIKNGKILFNNKLFTEIKVYSNEPIKVESKKRFYRGYIKIILKNNALRVINVVDIESYIYGVVTSESISSWKLEALKSQAIASRTFAYYQSLKRKNWTYDVLDNTGDQVYKGKAGEHKKGIKATDATRGIILTYKDKPIFAQYTANSGWNSASSFEIFKVKKEYLYGHRDDFSKKMPLGTWKTKVSIKKIEKEMIKKGIKIGTLQDIKVYKVGKSGRALQVKFIGSNGTKVLNSYTSIRRFAKLKDILMDIKKENGYFYFKGGGFGHGVGYSQWGGQAMAKSGYTYDEILKFYYKSVILKRFW